MSRTVAYIIGQQPQVVFRQLKGQQDFSRNVFSALVYAHKERQHGRIGKIFLRQVIPHRQDLLTAEQNVLAVGNISAADIENRHTVPEGRFLAELLHVQPDDVAFHIR